MTAQLFDKSSYFLLDNKQPDDRAYHANSIKSDLLYLSPDAC